MKNIYGFIGFISLLGFIGLFGKEPLFLSFFAFALFFKYFLVQPDEFFIETIRKCAAYAFFINLFIVAGATFVFSYFEISSNPLAGGTALGFGISIAIFTFMTFIMEWKEQLGARND
jgi:hypothetical protein